VKALVTRPLCIVAMGAACACGLDQNGLLDASDAGKESDATLVGDTGAADTAPSDGLPVSVDAPQDMGTGADVLVDVALEDRPIAMGDASPDSFAGPHDAMPDTRADAIPDAMPEAMIDAPPDGTADAPVDSGPRPLIWDGGGVADPQFFDSDWIFFCSTLVACGEMPSVSACMSQLHQPSSPDALIPPFYVVRNVNNASPMCAAVATALGGGTVCPSATADTCSGNSLSTCRLGFTMTIDCGRLGMVCSNGNGNAGCGFGDCAPSQEGKTYCVGSNYVARCKSGRYVPLLDCQTFAATCIGPPGAAQCQGGGRPCSGAAPSCSGTAIVQCMAGMQASLDCSSAYDPSFTCLLSAAAVPSCAADTMCDPGTYMDSCTGMNQLDFCNAGSVTTYNCRANAFNRCLGGHCMP
jgi:hypothetical protein